MIQRYPAGFYILGLEVRDSDAHVTARPWSLQGLRMLSPGEQYQFETIVQNPSRASTAHAWGLCRLLCVRLGMYGIEPIDGALFINIDKTIQPGFKLCVIVEALDFEPLTTLEG